MSCSNTGERQPQTLAKSALSCYRGEWSLKSGGLHYSSDVSVDRTLLSDQYKIVICSGARYTTHNFQRRQMKYAVEN